MELMMHCITMQGCSFTLALMAGMYRPANDNKPKKLENFLEPEEARLKFLDAFFSDFERGLKDD